MTNRVIIVGAGQAGFQAAVSLRQDGFRGELLLLGKEQHLPYQRPPLSKQILKGEWPAEKCLLRHTGFLQEHDILFRSGTAAVALDCSARRLQLADGTHLDYAALVICTGSRPRRLELPGADLHGDLRGVHYLRRLEDALALHEEFTPGRKLVVAGAGYIGLEVAASARERGLEVTVLEALPGALQRSALPPVADFLLGLHRAHGVAFHFDARLSEIHGGPAVQAVSLDDGRRLDCELLMVGIGVTPDIDWLAGSEVRTNRGVRVDLQCRTNVPGIYAAGDVAELDHALYSGPLLLESVQNAVSQGRLVASNIMGAEESYNEVPWFWSEQYGARLQMAGLPQPGDTLVIRDSGPNSEASISVLSLGGDRLNAIQCVHAPRDFMAARKLIALGAAVDRAALVNPATDLKDLL